MMSPLQFVPMLLFLFFPLLEIAVLILVGQWIGLWPTLGLLVLSAIAGMLIIRQQGLSMFGRMFDAMSRGDLVINSLADSYTTILAGCLLIVPGLLSDALGVALLVPPLRRLLVGAMLPGFAASRREQPSQSETRRDAKAAARPIVIEGTYERLDDNGRSKP